MLKAKKIKPGLWAKAFIDSNGNRHIYMSEFEGHVDKGGGPHDHYYTIDGVWHVQIGNKNKHYLPVDQPFGVEEIQPILNRLFDELYNS